MFAAQNQPTDKMKKFLLRWMRQYLGHTRAENQQLFETYTLPYLRLQTTI